MAGFEIEGGLLIECPCLLYGLVFIKLYWSCDTGENVPLIDVAEEDSGDCYQDGYVECGSCPWCACMR